MSEEKILAGNNLDEKAKEIQKELNFIDNDSFIVIGNKGFAKSDIAKFAVYEEEGKNYCDIKSLS